MTKDLNLIFLVLQASSHIGYFIILLLEGSSKLLIVGSNHLKKLVDPAMGEFQPIAFLLHQFDGDSSLLPPCRPPEI
jgi:hypothetical protein